jgi:hypothetical protein
VHVASFAADEGFVNLDFPREIPSGEIVLHSQTDAMKHEPRRLLSDLYGAVEFPGRNPITVAGDHPHCGKPLIEAKRRIFKDRPELDRELSFRMPSLALEHAARSDEADILGAASRADWNPIAPALRGQIRNTIVGILEVHNRFHQCFRLCRVLCRVLLVVLYFAHITTLAEKV